MYTRETTIRAALLKAAAAAKVDHAAALDGKGNWIARRAILNTERKGIGVKTEYDQRPIKGN